MTATFKINFKDGTSKEILLDKAIEIKDTESMKKSVVFQQTSKGTWVMSYTSSIFEEKQFDTIEVYKNL